MADITHRLMIKYGLSRAPTQAESNQWVQLVEALIAQGVPREEAGRRAAAQLLPGFETHVYASEADTLEMLLNRVKDK